MTAYVDGFERSASRAPPKRGPFPSHAIFYDGELKPQAGGPSGYLWNLRKGIADCGQSDRVRFIVRDVDRAAGRSPYPAPSVTMARSKLDNFLERVPYAKSIQRSFIGGNFYRDWRRILKIAENPPSAQFDRDMASQIDLDGITSIHAHETIQAILLHNELKAKGIRSKVKLMLTSHCPELPGVERAAAYRNAGLFKPLSYRLRDAHVKADEYAFSVADVIIFPSPESTEPYTSASPSISTTLKQKDVRYVLTGVRTKEGADYPVPHALNRSSGQFVACFVGRHNSIKGYDMLKDAAKILFEKYPDFTVAVAGHPGPLEPLNHPRWIELGWTPNPEHLIAASDVFVLPNRSTFFDLVLLEAMSIGRPIIASRTGGNITVAGMSDGILLFDDLNGLVSKLEQLRDLSKFEQNRLAQSNQTAYRDNFSIKHFAAGYLNAISDQLAGI